MVQTKTLDASSVICIINVLRLVPVESLNSQRQDVHPVNASYDTGFINFFLVLQVNSPLPFICLLFQSCPKFFIFLELALAPVTEYFTCIERRKRKARLTRKRQRQM